MNLFESQKLQAEIIRRQPAIFVASTGESLEIKVPTLGKVIEINPYLAQIEKDDLTYLKKKIETADTDSFWDEMPEIFSKYGELLIEIFKRIIEKDDVSKYNFDDMMQAFIAFAYRMGSKSFLTSTIVAWHHIGLNSEPELIAAEKFLTQLTTL